MVSRTIRHSARLPARAPNGLAARIPHWMVLPGSTDEADQSVLAMPAGAAIRFPRALTPTLAAAIGELDVPAIVAAVEGHQLRQDCWFMADSSGTTGPRPLVSRWLSRQDVAKPEE